MYPTRLHSYLLWRSTVDSDSQALAKRRYTATVSLIPAAMVGIFVFGWYAVLLVAVSMLSAFVAEVFCHRILFKGSPGSRDGVWLFTGLLLGLLLPPNAPLWIPMVGGLVAIIAGKYFLSVDGMPLFQPVALGFFFLSLAGAITFLLGSHNVMNPTVDGRPAWPVLVRVVDTSAEDVKEGGVWKILRGFFGGDVRKSVPLLQHRDANFSDQPMTWQAVHGPRPLDLVKKYPSQPVSQPRQSEKPDGGLPGNSSVTYDWLQMVLGYIPATIGGSSALALAFGILLLIFSGANTWILPAFAYATLFAGFHFAAWFGAGCSGALVVPDNIPIHLLTGSTILAVFYMAADPLTAPRSALGKVYAGVALGLIELLLRLFTPLAEGLFLSVVIVQLLSFVIDLWLAPPAERHAGNAAVGLSSTSLGRL
jgi:electron transport complex protein RnfD